MPTPRNPSPTLNAADVENHFIALCEGPTDPFLGVQRFIKTFAYGQTDRRALLNYTVTLHRGMQSRGGISDAD